MSGMIPYGTSWPTLTPGQFSFAGVTIGGVGTGVSYALVSIDGLEQVDVNSGDVLRPLVGGQFGGSDVPGGRDITVKFVLRASTAAALDTARVAMSGAFQAGLATEQPLILQTLGGNTYGVMAKARKFAAPITNIGIQAYACNATVQFHATDWRLYGQTQQVAGSIVAGSTTAVGLSITPAGTVPSPLLVLLNYNEPTETTGDVFEGVTIACSASGLSLAYSYVFVAESIGGLVAAIEVDTDAMQAVVSGAWNPALTLFASLNASLAYPANWSPVPAGTATVDVSLTGNTLANAIAVDVQYANAYAGV